MADDLRLLENLLRHEVSVIALVDKRRRNIRDLDRTLNLVAVCVEYARLLARQLNSVAIFEEADPAGHRRERKGVGSEIHGTLAIADRKRRAAARADDKIFLALEHNAERKSTFELDKRGGRGLARRKPLVEIVRHEMRDDLRVGFGHKHGTAGRQPFP